MEKIEEVEKDMTPKLIGEVYLKLDIKNNKYFKYGVYECQYCKEEFECKSKYINYGDTKSCGCLRKLQKIKHGIKHGLTHNKFYKSWLDMIYRCTNPKNSSYKNYGGRGIKVCEEWLDVANFVAWCESTYYKGDGYSLDRIDNNKDYTPENCRWVDKTTQVINRRKMKNNTSGFVGVTYYKSNKKWGATIGNNNKLKHLGSFPTIEEAVQARDNYIIENNLPHKLSTQY